MLTLNHYCRFQKAVFSSSGDFVMGNRKAEIRKFGYKTFNKNTKTKGGNLRNLGNHAVKGFAPDVLITAF
jgi:hypothetical protein